MLFVFFKTFVYGRCGSCAQVPEICTDCEKCVFNFRQKLDQILVFEQNYEQCIYTSFTSWFVSSCTLSRHCKATIGHTHVIQRRRIRSIMLDTRSRYEHSREMLNKYTVVSPCPAAGHPKHMYVLEAQNFVIRPRRHPGQ